MKLAVSNIAWDPAEEDQVLELLARLGVSGVEVAPTKVWPNLAGASSAAAERYRAQLQARGFQIPALQALLFGRPELSLFGDADAQAALQRHLSVVAELGKGLGAEVMVFGSPKNRDRGALSIEDAMAAAVPALTGIAQACAPHGLRLCLEPNPQAYGCNFLTHWYEVKQLVERVGKPGVAVHLDAACIAVEGDDPLEAIAACAGSIAHFHVTEPNLQDFSQPSLDHAAIGRSLRHIGYDGWLSIEMRRSADPQRSIEQAVSFVLSHYS